MLQFVEIEKYMDKTLVGFMRDVYEEMNIKDWLAIDDEPELLNIIERGRKYSVVVLDIPNGIELSEETFKECVPAAIFLVNFYDIENKDFFGYSAGLTYEELKKTAVMDLSLVAPEYRGLGLQRKTIEYSEKLLKASGFKYLLATIHPDNKYSLNNAVKCGYEVKCQRTYYGGLPRLVLMKLI